MTERSYDRLFVATLDESRNNNLGKTVTCLGVLKISKQVLVQFPNYTLTACTRCTYNINAFDNSRSYKCKEGWGICRMKELPLLICPFELWAKFALA